MTAELVAEGVRLSAASSLPGARRFAVLAYTGGAVLGGRVAFDLEGLEHKQRVPILLQHDEARPIGFANLVRLTARGLELSGLLLDNEAGREVAAAADAGFPWEASIGLTDVRWESHPSGAVVNGRQLAGPLRVGRSARLVEVSFVTAGADKHTEAVALGLRAEPDGSMTARAILRRIAARSPHGAVGVLA